MDTVNAAVIKKFELRQTEGFIKYGQTMDRGDLTKEQWLIHLQEEMMDSILYIEKLIQLETGKEAKQDTGKFEEKVAHGKTFMPIGKYRGKFLEDIPEHYLKWFLAEVTGHDGIKAYIRERLGEA